MNDQLIVQEEITIVEIQNEVLEISIADEEVIVLTSEEAVEVSVSDEEVTVFVGAEQGPPGPPGPSGAEAFERIAATALSGHRAVIALANAVGYADNATLAHRDRYTGITLNAALGGEIVNIQRLGEATESSWNWIVDAPIYIGANGVLTQTPPVASTAAFSQIIGVAVSPTSIYLAPREPITL